MYKLLIRLFLILVVLICCILIGCFISNYYKKRNIFFAELLSFTQFLKTHVKHGNEKLAVVINRFSLSDSDNFNNLIFKYELFIDNKLDKIEFESFINNNLLFLKDKEKKTVFNFFITLGNFDEDCELTNLEVFEKNLENLVKFTTNESNKFSPFAIKMSVLIGSLLFIIFI